MTEYNYDRQDVYPPDFRDEYRVRHFDRSYDESMYFEYYQEQQSRSRDSLEHQRDLNELRISNAAALMSIKRKSHTDETSFNQTLWRTIVLPYYE